MPKHSLAYHAVPASAPTSPAVTRKSDRNPPATPQRVVQRTQSRQYASPCTPATNLSTPYTPLSLRSAPSSNGSSLATPISAASNRRLQLSVSPEASFHVKNKKSLADIAENWRTRANENGIKVSAGEESHYVDDEEDHSEADMSSFFSSDKALLPAPFLSTQRRARALSQVQPVTQSSAFSPVHHAQLSTPARASSQSFTLSPAFLNTPPPKAAIVNQLKFRGTVTDPAHTRRRPSFGQTTELCDIDEDEYVPYPQAFSPPTTAHFHSQTLPIALNDPFNLSNLSESFQFYETPSITQFEEPKTFATAVTACSVCGSTNGVLAILEPCAHPLCSACLTSALNIVGEKDMECAVCKAKVDDFKLQNFSGNSSNSPSGRSPKQSSGEGLAESFGLFPSVLDGAFEDFVDRAQGASTPIAGSREARQVSKADERVVLRVDNVPWDITPPAIATWLKHPVERVHVLLDRKGKTLSHAYAEMAGPEAAKAALRSSQNSVLGKGKRARGVTVTKTNQEELMRALFPSWQGNFDGSRPSLSGLDNEHVISTLQHGLISDTELKSLLHLIRSPDSHFLKVPSLPFYSLMSILSKFPADEDSRVFWSGSLRDMLFEVTHAAVQVLLSRVEENPYSEWTGLLAQLVRAAMDCQAFMAEQMSKLSDMLEAALPQSSSSPRSSDTATQTPDSSHGLVLPVPQSRKINPVCFDDMHYGDIAKEFGVEAHLVEALAQRLSKLN